MKYRWHLMLGYVARNEKKDKDKLTGALSILAVSLAIWRRESEMISIQRIVHLVLGLVLSAVIPSVMAETIPATVNTYEPSVIYFSDDPAIGSTFATPEDACIAPTSQPWGAVFDHMERKANGYAWGGGSYRCYYKLTDGRITWSYDADPQYDCHGGNWSSTTGLCTTYSCPSGLGYVLPFLSHTCFRKDCTATQVRSSVGICTEKPVGKDAKPDTCDAAASQPTTDHPISIGTGTKYWKETVYTGSGGINFTLNYSSRKPSDNYLPSFSVGTNWINGYEAHINPDGTDSNTIAPIAVSVLRPNGQLLGYTLKGTVYVTDADTSHTLTRLIDSGSATIGWQLVDSTHGTIERYDATGKLQALTDPSGKTQTLAYDTIGRLSTISDSQGRVLTLGYDTNNRVSTLTQPDAGIVQFTYDAQNNLAKITWPDTKTRIYLYEDSRFPNSLTGITDENGIRYTTYAYDANGRAVSENLAGGVAGTSLSFGTNSTTVTDALNSVRAYNFQSVLNVTKKTGQAQPGGSGCSASTSAQTYDANGNIATRSDFNGNTTNYSYDLTRNLETQRVEAVGKPEARTISTQWHAYWRQPVKLAEPKKLTTWTYNGDGGVYCAPTTATVPSLSGGTQPIGVVCSKTEQATSDLTGSAGFSATVTGNPRTWTYTYNQYGQVLTANGPRTDVADVTTTTYYDTTDPDPGKRGNIATVSNALGHLTRYTAYDLNGRPLSITDPNGVITTLTYWPRGWLKSRTVAGATTTYDYTAWGALAKITYPDGTGITYTYDPAHRLTDIIDSAGQRVHYTLDAAGNRTGEDALNADGSTARHISRVFDALGRLKDEIEGDANPPRTYGYYANGEAKFETTPLAATTTIDIDALGRPVKRTDPVNGSAKPSLLGYDSLDQLTQVAAPNGAVTAFTVDGLGNTLKEVSADRGTVDATFDAAGNLLTRKDARGLTVTDTYDALNRLIQIDSPATGGLAASTTRYIWDSASGCTYGIGRLCQITDGAGSTTFAYDARGNRVSETRVEGGETLVTLYAHNAADRPTNQTFPTSETVVPTLDAGGRVQALVASGSGGTTAIVSSIAYNATGQITAQQLGLTWLTVNYDSAGRVDTVNAANTGGSGQDGDVPIPFWALGALGAALMGMAGRTRRGSQSLLALLAVGLALQLPTPGQAADLDLQYDANGNVISKTTPGGTTNYTYDQLDRLDTEAGPAGARNHDYDANGNRLTDGAGTTATFTPNSDRVATINGVNVTLDAAGNLTSDGTYKYLWNGLGQLGELRKADNTLIATYYYDYRWLRTRKVTTAAAPQGAGTTFYHYDQEGHLVGETTPGNQPQATYVWNGDILTGYITYNPRTVYTVQVDHLGSPFQIRTLDGKIIWRWESDGYGRTPPNDDVDGDGKRLTFNLRYLGMYADQESGLFYNWHRYYSPRIGYVSPDPIGLAGGPNLYSYVRGNPLVYIDPTGQSQAVASLIIGTGLILAAGNSSSRPAGLKGKLESLWDKVCGNSPDPCSELQAKIGDAIAEIKIKYQDLLNDPYQLYTKAFDTKVSGLPGTWAGHVGQVERAQEHLRGLISLAKAIPCQYDPEADVWANMPTPSRPLPR